MGIQLRSCSAPKDWDQTQRNLRTHMPSPISRIVKNRLGNLVFSRVTSFKILTCNTCFITKYLASELDHALLILSPLEWAIRNAHLDAHFSCFVYENTNQKYILVMYNMFPIILLKITTTVVFKLGAIFKCYMLKCISDISHKPF